uniref:Uncharacterized protein n=1 Tax=Rhizochromulina marina TaxID=1034831 RepID=A0A7S2W9V8_9STRA|mmetsp:Transcript_18982/g.55218  ORF Transcript_18982/g.55218 Transcript_18982/m.55218 type:complete len:114 (+) Transcript_18982:23-364(+)
MMMLRLVSLLGLLAAASAFVPAVPRAVVSKHCLRMSEEGEQEKFFSTPPAQRLGTSVDQDGKSNVWAVEPKMQVEVGKEGQGVQQALVIGGGAAAAVALATLIVNVLPDPDMI